MPQSSWDCSRHKTKAHKAEPGQPTYKGKVECPFCVGLAQDRLAKYMEKRR